MHPGRPAAHPTPGGTTGWDEELRVTSHESRAGPAPARVYDSVTVTVTAGGGRDTQAPSRRLGRTRIHCRALACVVCPIMLRRSRAPAPAAAPVPIGKWVIGLRRLADLNQC